MQDFQLKHFGFHIHTQHKNNGSTIALAPTAKKAMLNAIRKIVTVTGNFILSEEPHMHS